MVFANVPLKLGYARSKRFAMYIDNGIVKAIEVRGRSKEGDRQRESDSERDGGGEKQRETAGETETEGETESETKDSVFCRRWSKHRLYSVQPPTLVTRIQLIYCSSQLTPTLSILPSYRSSHSIHYHLTVP